MRTLTVVIPVDDVAVSIAELATLGTAVPQIADALNTDPDTNAARKLHGVLWFRVYAEGGNDGGDITHSEARIGFESTNVKGNFLTSRVLATAHGSPLLPGLATDFISAGVAGIYDLATTAISGKTGDKFQIHYGPL